MRDMNDIEYNMKCVKKCCRDGGYEKEVNKNKYINMKYE
jgi:hypothetical protein